MGRILLAAGSVFFFSMTLALAQDPPPEPQPPADPLIEQPAAPTAQEPAAGENPLANEPGDNPALRNATESRRRAELEARRAVVQARAADEAEARRQRIRNRPLTPTPAQIALSRMGPQTWSFGGVVSPDPFGWGTGWNPWRRPVIVTTQPVSVPIPYHVNSSGFSYSNY